MKHWSVYMDNVVAVLSGALERLTAHPERQRASAAEDPPAPPAPPAVPPTLHPVSVALDARTKFTVVANPLDREDRPTCVAPRNGQDATGARTAEMDQMAVWQHVLRFRPVNHSRAPTSHMAAVSPGVRCLCEVGSSFSIRDLPVLFWWLRQQANVGIVASRYDLTSASLMALLAQLPGMLVVQFGFGGITDVELAHLHGLTQLQTLHLSLCRRITDAGLVHLRGLTNLEELRLSCCELVSDVGLSHLNRLTRLQTLDLSRCRRITDAGLVHLRGLINLQELRLSHCDLVTDAGLAHLRGLMQLRILQLRRCRLITDAGLVELEGLPQLRALDLAFCTLITDDGLTSLMGLTWLEAVHLDGCPLIALEWNSSLRLHQSRSRCLR